MAQSQNVTDKSDRLMDKQTDRIDQTYKTPDQCLTKYTDTWVLNHVPLLNLAIR